MRKLLLTIALLLGAGAAHASQNSLVGGNFPTTSPYPGLTLVENINSAMEAINSMNSGASAPSYEVQGTMFANTSSGLEEFYSGSNWLLTGAYTGSAYVPVSNGVPLGTCPTTTGSSNAYVLTYSPAPTAWVTGQPYCFYTNFSNTGSATVNPNGLGAKPLTKFGTTSLASGDLGSGVEVECIYDGTDCEITSQIASSLSAASAWSVLNNGTGSSATPTYTATPSAQAWYLGTTQATSSGKSGLISPSAGAVVLEANGNAALFASSTGNIGVGTTSPSTALAVIGEISATGGLAATSTSNTPCAGCVGYPLQAVTTPGGAVNLSNSTGAAIASLGLPAGDWMLSGQIEFNGTSSTAVTGFFAAVNTTSGGVTDQPFGFLSAYEGGATVFNSIAPISMSLAPQRVSISATTTYYLNGQCDFTVSSCDAYGSLYAYRTD